MARALTSHERRLTFLLQSYSFDAHRVSESEEQVTEMESVFNQLQRKFELLPRDDPSYSEHATLVESFSNTIQQHRTRVMQARKREHLLSVSPGYERKSEVSIEMQQLMEQRESVGRSQKQANEFLMQTEATKEALAASNMGLHRIKEKNSGIIGSFTSSGGLLGSISRQTRKNTVVMGLAIGAGSVFLIWWWLSS
eukprot:TRINITY_DN10425_c0_g1_i1.p1 TRINITY_DN10425_c0_g1~~TRINITY_DN10425_c0_g1_i1.p1  ORF type:complete len:196 (+),score=48.58 TRINITY_DN10425_c0_g1_i1:176-763(+)